MFNASGNMSDVWQMVSYLSAGVISGLITSLVTKRVREDKLDKFFELIHTPIKPGEVVECQPIGLLEMNESGEVDHKILAAMEQDEVSISPGLREELSEFIYAVFAQYPGVNVQVGEIRSLQAALDHIQASRAAIT
jgi:inorganic pyrophosphatase